MTEEPDDPIVLGLSHAPRAADIDAIRAEIAETRSTRRSRFAGKFIMAALSSIPWVGGYISAMTAFRMDEDSVRQNDLQTEWLEEHHGKLQELQTTLADVDGRFEAMGDAVNERIESEEYLGLVRKAFRVWDEADTREKRGYVANLVTNAGGTRLCSDDLVRLFIDWLSLYHEAHFAVIREISKNPGSTRRDIWEALYSLDVTDDSAEADLFKLLFRDLSTGGVIRQERDTNQLGQFIRRSSPKISKGTASRTMKSPFDDKEAYVLTGMGKQFVHYTMNETIVRLESQTR